MLTGAWCLLAVAWAGEAELAIERGLVALELQDTSRARSQGLRALTAEPTLGAGQDLYTDATAAAGFGTLGATELMLYERDDPAWIPTTRALDEALRSGDFRSTKDSALALVEGWPHRPELLLPLWIVPQSSPKATKLGQRLLRAFMDPKVLIAADPEVLYRLRRLVMEVGEPSDREVLELRLVELGEDRPPPRPHLSRVERTEVAHQLSKESVPVLPWGYPSELVDVVRRLSDTWEKAGRFRHSALAWSQLQRVSDDPMAWVGEAEALLADGEIEAALRAADEGVLRAATPRWTDLGALASDRQRSDLARSLLGRARVHHGNGDTRRALGDLGLANALAGESLDDRLSERLADASLPLVQMLRSKYGGRGTPADAAMAFARGTEDRDTAITHLDDGLFLLTVGTRGGIGVGESPELYAGPFADLLMTRAQTEQRHGRVDAGRAAAVAATALTERSRPWWWKTRGELQDDSGQTDAAFASWAVARGIGVPGLEESLERGYVGPASWEVAANHIGGPPPLEPLEPPDAPVATTYRPPARGPASGRRGSSRPAGAPRLGETFPAFSVQTGFGTLNTAALRGRALVVTFWESDCGECLQMLPSMGSLARRLKADGYDTVVIAVSTDEDDSEFEQVYRIGDRWGELVRDPGLARKLGVDRLPTTWVVDTEGVARYFVDHWISMEELEAQVRSSLR